jgi:tRNA-Thr(GGU) m(6)t(6)A37 methyltransferase TsaA
MQVVFQPVGVVRNRAADSQVRTEKQDLEGELEIFPQYEQALDGIEGFSHLFVLFHFHHLRSEQIGPLKVKPKRLVKRGFRLEDLPELGVFALDSPTRPNPIGLTLVRLVRREGARLVVAGLDCFDGTPVLDIKGYRPGYRPASYTLPDWYTRLMNEAGHI